MGLREDEALPPAELSVVAPSASVTVTLKIARRLPGLSQDWGPLGMALALFERGEPDALIELVRLALKSAQIHSDVCAARVDNEEHCKRIPPSMLRLLGDDAPRWVELGVRRRLGRSHAERRQAEEALDAAFAARPDLAECPLFHHNTDYSFGYRLGAKPQIKAASKNLDPGHPGCCVCHPDEPIPT